MLGLLLLPCLVQGIPHPHVPSANSTKSCGCISEEERRALSPIPEDHSISEEQKQELSQIPTDLSMVDCRSRCSHSPFFAFSSSSQLKHHIDGEQDSGHHIPSVGSCICGSESSSPRPCSDVATIPVFCTSTHGQQLLADRSEEGQRPDYSMMALVLLSIAITAIGLTGARAVWQARRRRLRLAKENESKKRSSLAATIAIAKTVIAPCDMGGTSLGKGSLSVEVGQIVVGHDHPLNINEGVDERKP